MSLPHALLGLINYKPATGYDLKMAFEKSIHFFWNSTLPQIYRTLNQMESKGWVASTMEHQEGKPSRRVYILTDEGRAEFLRWLAEPPEEPERRMPLLVKVFFGNTMPREEFMEQIGQYRRHLAGLLDRYEREVPPIITDYAGRMGKAGDPYFWSLTLDFGKRHMQATIDWCDTILGENWPPKDDGSHEA
jgi:PadR family transcriptional regulator, regulatory protein AphA